MECTIGKEKGNLQVVFLKAENELEKFQASFVKKLFSPTYLSTFFLPQQEKSYLFVGMGSKNVEEPRILMELVATGCKKAMELGFDAFTIDVRHLIQDGNGQALSAAIKTIYLVCDEKFTSKTNVSKREIVVGVVGYDAPSEKAYQEGKILAESIQFARDLVNLPSNYLRPEDFAKEILDFCKGTAIETEVLTLQDLQEKKMGGLLAVGESSAFPPCMVILRYFGNPSSKEVTGLVGKGVTVDTGGYCLKPASGMMGIRGDMAGGAAVAGALRALAKQQAKCNAVAVIPMCENRISNGSYVDGDIITSFSKKTIEVCNTDAEGRIILADAMTWAVQEEKVTRVLDIATLTGAVVGMFGFTVGGVLCDNDALYEEFQEAAHISGEQHSRIPYEELHEKMIESHVADVKNTGGAVCGTITAGLFIRRFAQNLPWIHVDIAGTAWVDDPIYAFQDRYATGVDVDTIYQWLK